MKITHYIGSLRFGGIERLVCELSQAQIDSGQDVKILVAKEQGEFKDVFSSLATKFIFIHLTSGMDLRVSRFKLLWKYFRNSDVIHLHEFHPLVVLTAVLSSKRIIYTEHGNFAFGRKMSASDRLNFFLRKLFFRLSRAIICCNSAFTEQVVRSKFYTGKRLKMIHNGIPFDKKINPVLVERLKENYKGKFIIGTCSRLAGFKRVDRLIELFEKFHHDQPDSMLLIVGNGPEQERLQQLVQAKKMETTVEFAGFQAEISSYQSIFDICIFPSENEPFGLVALECYDLKKPVLVYHNAGGLCEIVKKQEPADICSTDKDMIDRIYHYQKNGITLRAEIFAYFSVERMSNDYLKIYHKK